MRGQTRKRAKWPRIGLLASSGWKVPTDRIRDLLGNCRITTYRRRPVCLPSFRRHLCPGSSTSGDIEAQRAIPDPFTYCTHCSSRTPRAPSSTATTSATSTDDRLGLTTASAPCLPSANYPRPDWSAYCAPIRYWIFVEKNGSKPEFGVEPKCSGTISLDFA